MSPVPRFSEIYPGILVEGGCKWVNCDLSHENYYLLTFNLVDEVFTTVRLTLFDRYSNLSCSFLTFKEATGLVVLHEGGGGLFLDVWVMEKMGNYDSWTKQFTVEVSPRSILGLELLVWKDDYLLTLEAGTPFKMGVVSSSNANTSRP